MLTVVNIPNFLTLLRIVAIPCFLVFLESYQFREALVVFVAAGITDGLDGAIARLMRTKTTLGAYLDPAADKMLLLSSFIALGFMHEVPRWLVVVVISRDVVIVAGYLLLFMLTQRTMEIRPSASGKASTALQLLSVTMVLVSLVNRDTFQLAIQEGVFFATGLLTTIAGLQYMYRGLAWFQGETGASNSPSSTKGSSNPDSSGQRRQA